MISVRLSREERQAGGRPKRSSLSVETGTEKPPVHKQEDLTVRLPSFVIRLVLGLHVVSAVLWPEDSIAEELEVRIEIDTSVQKGRISPFIFGAGIDHKTNPLRAPQYPDKVLSRIAESGLRIARYPGGFVFNRNDHRGSWSNFYWQDHIGKIVTDIRPRCMTSTRFCSSANDSASNR